MSQKIDTLLEAREENLFDLLPRPLPRILQADVVEYGKVWLEFSEGTKGLVDFLPVMARGGIFSPLSDPEFFNQARIGEGGHSLEWPGELDFCADALWLKIKGYGK